MSDASAISSLRLNLGCGSKRKPGWVNVDVRPPADVLLDLADERTPWPWADGSVSEVEMVHVLEHLGRIPEQYCYALRELWRVCKHRARILIVVPHPRHDHFLNDPTHVRAITPDGLALFSARLNREWAAAGASNSSLALDNGVDFEIVQVEEVPDPTWEQVRKKDWLGWLTAKRHQNNVVAEYIITLNAIKECCK